MTILSRLVQAALSGNEDRTALAEGPGRDISYRRLDEMATRFLTAVSRVARQGETALIHIAGWTHRAAAVLAAVRCGTPFFLNFPAVLGAQEAAFFLPGRVGVIGEEPEPESRPAGDGPGKAPAAPLWYLFGTGEAPFFHVQELYDDPAVRLLKDRIARMELSAESCLLSLPGSFCPGDAASMLCVLLSGGCWIPVDGEADHPLEAMASHAVTHMEGSPDQVEALLSLCGDKEIAALRCVVFHSTAPDEALIGYLRRTMPGVRFLRAAPLPEGGPFPCEAVRSSAHPGRVWIHGLELSVDAYARLCASLPGVQRAWITEAGEGVLECFVLPGDGFDPERLVSALQRRLPSFLHPRVWYRLKASVPPPIGSDRAQLMQCSSPLRLSVGVGEADPVTREILSIWADVLQLDVVRAQDSFFRLGGGSYQMTQAYARLREAFPVKFRFSELYQNVRAADLAAFLTAQMKRQGTYEAYLQKEDGLL